MERKPKERIIFDEDPYFGSDGEKAAIEDLMDRDGLTEEEVRETYTDTEIFEHQMALRDLDYEDEITALTAYLAGEPSDMSSSFSKKGGNPLIVKGTIGRFDGTRSGFSVFKDFDELLHGSDSPFMDCEIQKIWDENGSLFIHGAHHDGSVSVELRQLSDAGVDAYDAISDAWVNEPFTAGGKSYDGSEHSVFEAMSDLWDTTAPPRYMERAFGVPAWEYMEPEPVRPTDLTTGKWRVHLVMPGDHYGRSGSKVYAQAEADKFGSGLPLVEFYDLSQNPLEFPGGQFVSRYYMDTLLGIDGLKLGTPIREMQALSLDGAVPAWTIGGRDLQQVAAWLGEVYKSCKGASRPDHGAVGLELEAAAMRGASQTLTEGRDSSGMAVHHDR